MKKIIEQDICAKCANVSLMEPPPPGAQQWELRPVCASGWPYTRVCVEANAISDCPCFQEQQI